MIELPPPWTPDSPTEFGLYWLTAWIEEKQAWCRPFLIHYYPKTASNDVGLIVVLPLGEGDKVNEMMEGCDYYDRPEDREPLRFAPCAMPSGAAWLKEDDEDGDLPSFDVTVRATADVEAVITNIRAPDEATARDYATIQAEEGEVKWEYKGVVDDPRIQTTKVRQRP